MDKLLLKILLWICKPLFARQGIDLQRLRSIVEIKLMMDGRRVNFSWRRQNQKQETNNQLTWVLIMYGFFGLFIGVFIAFVPSFMLGMILFHTYLIFMMAMTLITDFSTVLLDTTDNQIILPRPISSKTLFMARMVHILIYLFQFTLALSIISWGAIFYRYGGLVGLGAIITSILTVLLAVFLTYCLYLLLMLVTSEQKVKEVITYFQIFMTIFFAVSYQLVPRLVSMGDRLQDFSLHWYSYLLPPVWMAMALEGLQEFHFDQLHIWMSMVSVAVPVSLFWMLNKYLAPSFAKKLAASGVEASTTVKAGTKGEEKLDKGISARLADLFCASPIEKSAFRLTWKISGRDKSFRLQFYPNLGYIIVFLFIFVFNSGRDVAAHWESLPTSNNFLWLIYLPMFSISGAIMLVAFNENYAASWIYYSTPIENPGNLVSGTIKSLFIKYFIPIYFLLFLFALYIWGIAVADDFLFGFFNNLLLFLLFGFLSPHYLPFSRQPNTRQQAGRFIITIVQMITIAVLVGLHFVAIKYSAWLLYIIIALIIPGIWILIKKIQSLGWDKISV